jgi:hypothetical protein
MTGSLNVIGGNVGIGTTLPSSSLEINKNVSYTEIIGSANNPAIRIKNTNSTNFNEKAEVQFTIGNSVLPTAAISNLYTSFTAGTQQGGDLVFSTRVAGSTLDERMRILYNGNIGIGTTSPSSLLHVVNPNVEVASQPGITSQFVSNVDGRSVIRVENSNGNSTAGATGTALSLVSYSDSSNNPSANKHEAQILLGAKTSGQDGALRVIAPRNIDFYTNAQNVIMTGSAFANYGTFAVTITSGSNIGIGTTSPAYKVDISGSTSITGGGLIVSGTLATSGSTSQGLIAPLKFTTAPVNTNYTLVYTDEGKMVEMNYNVDAPLTVTIPLNSSVPFPIGTEISVIQIGAGTTVITGSAGVTVNSYLGYKTIDAQYGVASVVKRGTDSWYLFGNLS